jgi:uncharacterized protein
MKIIIAGGTGQIGGRLSRLLAKSGHEVWVLTRRSGKTSALGNLQFAAWDARTAGAWVRLVDGADVVVNLTGENIGGKPWSAKQLALIRSSRTEAGRALVEAVKAASEKPALLVQASAVGFYGTDKDYALDENSPAGTDLLADICLEWEGSTREVEDLGLRRVIIRTGLVLEKNKGVLPRMLLPFRLFSGGPLGDGRQVLSWIHLEDELAAIKFLIEDPAAAGAYNLTAPAPVTNGEFGRVLARVIHRPFWLAVPAFALKLILGAQSKLVLEGQEVLPERLKQGGFKFQYPYLHEALEDILG